MSCSWCPCHSFDFCDILKDLSHRLTNFIVRTLPPFDRMMRSLRLSILFGFTLLFSFAAAQCPTYNGTTYVDSGGSTVWSMYCGFDSSPGSYSTITTGVLTMDSCMLRCDADSRCGGITFVPGADASTSGTCYMKNSVSSHAASSNSNLNSATKIPPYPAPVANNGNSSSGCGSALPSYVTAGGSSVVVSFTAPDGTARAYTIHVPYLYNSNVAAPLIMAFHGAGDTSSTSEGQTGYSAENYNPYAIAVYPQGINVSMSQFVDS